MTIIVDLRPDTSLLNNEFEKYQFCSEIVQIIQKRSLENNVFRREPSSGQDSWLEAKLFCYHNHLFKNPFDLSCWFCDDSFQIWQLKIDGNLTAVHKLTCENSAIIYNPTITFASEKIVVVTSGENRSLEVLILLESGKYKAFSVENAEAGVLLDSRELREHSKLIVAMYYIVEIEKKKQSKLVILSYNLNTINESIDSINLIQKHELIINGPVEYVYIESSGQVINILSQDAAKFTFDSLKKINDEIIHNEKSTHDSELKFPKYSWSQDTESLTVWIKIPKKYKDEKVVVKITATSLLVSVQDTIMVQGELSFRVDSETAVWTRESDNLKLEVMKHEIGQMWSELIRGDTDGECLPDEVLAAEIHSRLSHLCTDQNETNTADQPAPLFNSEQLEECDFDGKENILQRIDLISHTTTHLAPLTAHNRLLFTQKSKSSQILCIRHDHDGCIWTYDSLTNNSDQWNMRHTSTLPGFGYVEASKTNKKFCISPPDASFVAIIEHVRHGFLYEKPVTAARISKQRIIDLGPDAQPIMGAVAMNEFVILLTKNKLYQLKV